ncbi:MAG: ribosome maturation factor RimP [Pseudomonadota bacterium]
MDALIDTPLDPVAPHDRAEERLVREDGVDARIAAVVAPVLEDMGYRLVRARLFDHNGLTLQIMAERPDGTMAVSDCEAVSKAVSPVLDVEDPVSQAYNLEVSSPGIDRPLVRRGDFEIWIGHRAKIETATLIEGRKRFKGTLAGLKDDTLILRRLDAPKDEPQENNIPLASVASASLILTDELITEALKRDKALRAANGLADGTDDQDN